MRVSIGMRSPERNFGRRKRRLRLLRVYTASFPLPDDPLLPVPLRPADLPEEEREFSEEVALVRASGWAEQHEAWLSLIAAQSPFPAPLIKGEGG